MCLAGRLLSSLALCAFQLKSLSSIKDKNKAAYEARKKAGKQVGFAPLQERTIKPRTTHSLPLSHTHTRTIPCTNTRSIFRMAGSKSTPTLAQESTCTRTFTPRSALRGTQQSPHRRHVSLSVGWDGLALASKVLQLMVSPPLTLR